MSQLRVLIVDDNRSAADALSRVLRKGGDEVSAVYDGQTAIDELRRNRPDVVLTDLKMEPVDGMAVLDAARALRPPVEVIVFTAFGAVEVAVRAMQNGARDFLTKPVTAEQVQERLGLIRAPVHHGPLEEFVAVSSAAKRFVQQLKTGVGVPSSVWIEGEIGTGRNFAAHTLHRLDREDLPFAVIDPYRDEPWPRDGTVVLPDVDTLPDDLQRAVYRRVREASADVRIVVTSSPGARQRVVDGSLRPELFYALAVICVTLPPLRDRVEDIEALVNAAFAAYADRYGRELPRLTPGQWSSLKGRPWPGNVRELRNLAERVVVMGADALGEAVSPPGQLFAMPVIEHGFSLSAYLEQVERGLLHDALRRSNGDRAEAGKLLGVERNTLRYKLNKYDLL